MKSNDQHQELSCILDEEDDEIRLPGFRFHPTDEELVGFYLRRKVDKKSLSIELIKQVDIYKFDPWDLPKASGGTEREGYFFCRRGRKYRNSIRPNRVTGSGFWKATGIDKPVYSRGGDCIGLKKTLVYYRGSAGKGTKTDWMMHEFRLPTNETTHPNSTNPKHNTLPEAEVWTLCRIFKRSISHRKYTHDWRELSSKNQQQTATTAPRNLDTSSNTCSVESNITKENYLNFATTTPIMQYTDRKPQLNQNVINGRKVHELQYSDQQLNMFSIAQQIIPSMAAASSSNISSPPFANDFFTYNADWDELRSVVEFALDHPSHL